MARPCLSGPVCPGKRAALAVPLCLALAWVLGLATALVPPPAGAAAELTQLTEASGVTCDSLGVVSDATGALLSFESDCDLVTGSNSDGNREIFQVSSAGTVTQLSDTSDCINSAASSDSDGDVVAFESNCDLVTGSNTDGSFEIFVLSGGTISQISSGSSCSSLEPSVDAAGSLVAFASDCDLGGQNSDLNMEIFLATVGGSTTQLTNDVTASGCGSAAASISGDGSLVSFESDCDLGGDNEDEISQIFQVTSSGTVTQLTSPAEDDCSSFEPASNSGGSLVAFTSNCDLTGGNSDGSDEVFSVGASTSVAQLSDDDGSSACESGSPTLTGDGEVVFFQSYCDAVGDNSDGSREIFRTGCSTGLQVTDATGCSSFAPAVSSDGSSLSFSSDCDHTGGNSGGEEELFQTALCSCGGPASGCGPDQPTATDALLTLKTAVFLTTCELCQCDVNSSGAVTATDALLILKKAVQLPVTLSCPSS